MKVLHLTYDMRIGGTEMVIKNIIENNSDTEFEMSVFCIEEPLGPWGNELKEKGIKISSQNRATGFDFSLISGLRTYLKNERIDILHCHQYTPWAYGALAAAGTKTKVIFTEHGRFYPDSSSWKRRIVNPILAKLTSSITTISEATKQALVEFEFIPEKLIEVIYNGISPLKTDDNLSRLKNELGIKDSIFVFGTIARLDPIKNQTMMIRSFADVIKEEPDCILLIVGDGEMMPHLKSLVKELGIKRYVKFTGYISNPANHLAIMDVFLLPSFSEGTSMTLLEAMSIGKTCIVTDAGGNPEIVAHGDTGIVTKNNSQPELTTAMKELLFSPEKTKSFGEAANARFAKLFHAQNMMRKYIAVYNRVRACADV